MSRRAASTNAARMPFGSRLRAARAARGPLCVGLDPHPALLDEWGLHDDVAGLEIFSRTLVDSLADRVALLKPQLAFFERHGSRGLAVLEQIVVEARNAGCLVLADAKRGDIGSTMQAYAEAFLDPRSSLAVDAVTVSPFLGVGSLAPAFDLAHEHHGGVFVLARTSNPEGRTVQDAVCTDGRRVSRSVLDDVRARNGEQAPWGSVGVVVGATLGMDTDADRDTAAGLDIGGPVLAPGVGAQGATIADLAAPFASVASSVYPVAARSVLGAGPEVGRLRAAADALNRQCVDILG